MGLRANLAGRSPPPPTVAGCFLSLTETNSMAWGLSVLALAGLPRPESVDCCFLGLLSLLAMAAAESLDSRRWWAAVGKPKRSRGGEPSPESARCALIPHLASCAWARSVTPRDDDDDDDDDEEDSSFLRGRGGRGAVTDVLSSLIRHEMMAGSDGTGDVLDCLRRWMISPKRLRAASLALRVGDVRWGLSSMPAS